jgi:hypothetical protein
VRVRPWRAYVRACEHARKHACERGVLTCVPVSILLLDVRGVAHREGESIDKDVNEQAHHLRRGYHSTHKIPTRRYHVCAEHLYTKRMASTLY